MSLDKTANAVVKNRGVSHRYPLSGNGERGQACIIALRKKLKHYGEQFLQSCFFLFWRRILDYYYLLPIIGIGMKLNSDAAHNSLVAPCRHQI
jgi:hypothetical protein